MISRTYPVNISKKNTLLSIPFFSNIAIPLVSIGDTALMGNWKLYLCYQHSSLGYVNDYWSFSCRMGTLGLLSNFIAKVMQLLKLY